MTTENPTRPSLIFTASTDRDLFRALRFVALARAKETSRYMMLDIRIGDDGTLDATDGRRAHSVSLAESLRLKLPEPGYYTVTKCTKSRLDLARDPEQSHTFPPVEDIHTSFDGSPLHDDCRRHRAVSSLGPDSPGAASLVLAHLVKSLKNSALNYDYISDALSAWTSGHDLQTMTNPDRSATAAHIHYTDGKGSIYRAAIMPMNFDPSTFYRVDCSA